MNECNILDLDAYCLFKIFDQIKIKCESKKSADQDIKIKYGELKSLALSCKWFKEMFQHWDEDLYTRLQIDQYFEESVITIDFGLMYNELQTASQRDQDMFWQTLVQQIEDNSNLHKAILKYTSGRRYENHMDLFDSIINVLAKKKTLYKLNIQIKGYTVDSLANFMHLRELHLDVKLNVRTLIKCCKSNPNLRVLSVLNNEYYGSIGDIVRFGEYLQKLNILELRMKENINDSEYIPLVKLPNLSELRIRGVYESGSLQRFFDEYARKTDGTLKRLIIEDAQLSADETKAISGIKTLKYLETGFSETNNISLLADLIDLEALHLTSGDSVVNILNEVVAILKANRQPHISIVFPFNNIDYYKAADKIVVHMTGKRALNTDYVPLCNLPNVRNLKVSGHILASQLGLLKCFSNKLPQILTKLELLSKIGCKEVSEIAAIRSLQTLHLRFADVSNVHQLAHLPHLRELIITVPQPAQSQLVKETCAALKKLFQTFASLPNPAFQYLDISGISLNLDIVSELSKIKSLKTLKCGFSNCLAIEVVSELMHLEELVIKTNHKLRCISQSILKFLKFTKNKIKIQLNKCRTIIQYDYSKGKTLELIFEKSIDLSPLASLGKLDCHSLTLSGDGNIYSLKHLYRELASNHSHCLKELFIRDVAIDSEEAEEISKISSLEVIHSWFITWQIVERLILHLTNLQEIVSITKRFNGSQFASFLMDKNEGRVILESNDIDMSLDFVKLSDAAPVLGSMDNLQMLQLIGEVDKDAIETILKSLASSPKTNLLQDLRIETSDNAELQIIPEIRSIKKLTLEYSEISNIHCLAEMHSLRELTIKTHTKGSLQRLLNELSARPSPTLKYLCVERGTLTADELRAVSSIRSLKKLDCHYENSLPLFSNLEELCITSYAVNGLFEEPSFYASSISTLRNLTIRAKPLNADDIAAVAQHKLLKKLHINLKQLESIDLLSSLNQLEELCVDLTFNSTSLAVPFNSFHYPQNLRNFSIKNLMIDIKDLHTVFEYPIPNALDWTLNKVEQIHIVENQKVVLLNSLKYHRDLSDTSSKYVQLENLFITLNEGVTKFLGFLATNKSTTLKQLYINGGICLNRQDVLEISKITSLTTLQVSSLPEDTLLFLSKLVNLEILTLESMYYNNDWHKLLQIARNCTKLERINFPFSDSYIPTTFLDDILDTLKIVRDPNRQRPLEIGFIGDKTESPAKEMSLIDKQQYIKLLNFPLLSVDSICMNS